MLGQGFNSIRGQTVSSVFKNIVPIETASPHMAIGTKGRFFMRTAAEEELKKIKMGLEVGIASQKFSVQAEREGLF